MARFCLKVFHIILKVLIYPEFFGKVSPHSVDFGVFVGLGLIYLLLFVMNSCDLLYLEVEVLVGLVSGMGVIHVTSCISLRGSSFWN